MTAQTEAGQVSPQERGAHTLVRYVTPVSVDHSGQHPFKKPGDTFEVNYKGRVYAARVQDTQPREMPSGSTLRDVLFQQVEGPLTRWGSV